MEYTEKEIILISQDPAKILGLLRERDSLRNERSELIKVINKLTEQVRK